jgi:DNA-binding transcriptional LysR family regulator
MQHKELTNPIKANIFMLTMRRICIMTPRQVRSVLTVLELGSVNRAAEALYLAPSSVSAQIRELSTELGVNLFEPAGRGIVASSALRQ